MSSFARAREYLSIRARSFFYDRLLRRVLRNSTYLFASNAISAVMGIVTANLLGVSVFGAWGIINGFVSNVNRLFSFRMGDVVVRYMGEALEKGEKERAGAVVKAAALTEALTSLAAFGVLALLAPIGALYFTKDSSLQPLFLLYGTSILANLIYETSTGVLQVTGHFRSQALINLLQSLLVAGLIVWAALTQRGLVEVLLAYLAGKVIIGMGPALVALYWLPRNLGRDWWKASFSFLPPWRELVRFALSTNFSATINLIARDSEVPWVGLFFDTTVAGYYKTALQLITLVITPVNPLISTTYPEIMRAWASRRFSDLKYLLRRVSLVAGAWTGAVGLGLLVLGQQLLFSPVTVFGHTFHIYKSQYLPAYPILLWLLVGYGLANILFWSRPLLLSQGLADYALKVSFWAMLAKLLLGILILPHSSYLVEAGLLSGYFAVSVYFMVRRGLSGVSREERLAAGG
jgi:O-antigen/teichoic acid export membrane protein